VGVCVCVCGVCVCVWCVCVCVCVDMMWYLLHLGFHPVAMVDKLKKKLERDSCTQNEKQYTKQYKNTEYTK